MMMVMMGDKVEETGDLVGENEGDEGEADELEKRCDSSENDRKERRKM